MRKMLIPVLTLALVACSTSRGSHAADAARVADPAMQTIVDRMAAAHAEIARLSIHRMPPGESKMWIVASTTKGRVGEVSDEEDLEAMRTGQPVTMREGHNLDYTEAVQDQAGKTIAVVGVTISGAANRSQDEQMNLAKRVAGETANAIRSAR